MARAETSPGNLHTGLKKKKIRKMALFPRTVDVFQLETAGNVRVVVVKSGARIRFKLINDESREELE